MPTMTLNAKDLQDLSPATREELMRKLMGRGTAAGPGLAPAQKDEDYKGIELDDVVDLTYREIQTWMEAASDKTKAGLRFIAENGPVVKAQELIDSGIENLPHFQSRTTIRTRTVTGDRNAFLLGWDDWTIVDDGEGRYAVTPITFQSLRRYFQLD